MVDAISSMSRRITISLYSTLPANSLQLYVNTPAPAAMSTTFFAQGHVGDVRTALLPAITYERLLALPRGHEAKGRIEVQGGRLQVWSTTR